MTDRRFYYAAIKRYGDKRWTAHHDVIEFTPTYTVSVSGCEIGDFEYNGDNRISWNFPTALSFCAFSTTSAMRWMTKY